MLMWDLLIAKGGVVVARRRGAPVRGIVGHWDSAELRGLISIEFNLEKASSGTSSSVCASKAVIHVTTWTSPNEELLQNWTLQSYCDPTGNPLAPRRTPPGKYCGLFLRASSRKDSQNPIALAWMSIIPTQFNNSNTMQLIRNTVQSKSCPASSILIDRRQGPLRHEHSTQPTPRHQFASSHRSKRGMHPRRTNIFSTFYRNILWTFRVFWTSKTKTHFNSKTNDGRIRNDFFDQQRKNKQKKRKETKKKKCKTTFLSVIVFMNYE